MRSNSLLTRTSTYPRLISSVLYRPSHESEMIANGSGVKYEKKRKTLLIVVALACPNPKAPEIKGFPAGFCM